MSSGVAHRTCLTDSALGSLSFGQSKLRDDGSVPVRAAGCVFSSLVPYTLTVSSFPFVLMSNEFWKWFRQPSWPTWLASWAGELEPAVSIATRGGQVFTGDWHVFDRQADGKTGGIGQSRRSATPRSNSASWRVMCPSASTAAAHASMMRRR